MDHCPLCKKGPLSSFGTHPNKDMARIGCRRCGEFFIDALAIPAAKGRPSEERAFVSAMTRAAWDSGRTLEIMSDDIPRLIDAAPRWTSPFEGVDRLLLLMASRAKRFTSPVEIEREDDYPLLCATGPDQVKDLFHMAWELRYLVQGKPLITADGWRRVDQLRRQQPDSRQAFVAMWFTPELDEAWEQGFKPGIEDSKYFRALRIDAIEHNQKIDDRIVAEIRRSGFVVADFTGNRGGVYYEAGLAAGLGLSVVFTCRNDSIGDVHFDTRQYNHIVWETPAELRSRLADRIAATVLPRDWRPDDPGN